MGGGRPPGRLPCLEGFSTRALNPGAAPGQAADGAWDLHRCAGDTALTAVDDMVSIVRLHTFLHRSRQLSEGRRQQAGREGSWDAAAGAAEGAAHRSAGERLWHIPGSGSVAVHDLTLHDASLVVTADTVRAPAAADIASVPGLQLGIQWLPPAAAAAERSRCRLTSKQQLPPAFVSALEALAQKGSEARGPLLARFVHQLCSFLCKLRCDRSPGGLSGLCFRV